MKLKSTIDAEDLFYPKSRKFNSGYVDVGDGHQLYFYEFGNPEGPPVLWYMVDLAKVLSRVVAIPVRMTRPSSA